jgi:hypothetical protein
MSSSISMQNLRLNKYLCKTIQKREISVYAVTDYRTDVNGCNPQ